VVIGPNEKEKYPQLLAKKFEALGQSVFTSKSGASHVYKITLDR
jgi:hypothetical protein